MRKFIVAAVQMDSGSCIEDNLKQAAGFIVEAVARGAKLVCLPENFNYIGSHFSDFAECVPDGNTFRTMAELAKKYRIWLHCGSIYERNPVDSRPYNCSVLIGPGGELAAKYRKLHLYDVVIPEGRAINESSRVSAGNTIVTADTGEVGHLGLSVCYDIRFGELYRIMALQGAEIFLIPSNFLESTGRAHWEPLLRARAIENSCYVIAPNQIGTKPRFEAYGNSMIIDPWGKILARGSNRPEVIIAEVDLDQLKRDRGRMFTLENRRPDVYDLRCKNG